MSLSLPDYLGPDPLARRFVEARASGSQVAFDALCRERGPRLLSLPLLNQAACRGLLAEIDARSRADQAARSTAPNSMHEYGAVLAEIGMADLSRALRELVTPLAAHYFPDTGGLEIDGEHAFIAEYGRDGDESLGYHVDDSAVTLNVCLGDDFSGTEIYFRGLRCDEHRQTPATPSETFELEHEVGTALLHAGRHRHGVHPIRRGRRRNLILWLQSANARAEARACRPWCGARGLV